MNTKKFSAIVILTVTSIALAQPPIFTGLQAAGGDQPGTILLTWDAAMIDTTGFSEIEAAYEFRFNTDPITIGNWDTSDILTSSLPGAVSLNYNISLNLNVMAYNNGVTIFWDRAHLRAWLTATTANLTFTIGVPNQTINFKVEESNGAGGWNIVAGQGGSAATNTAGMAEHITTDLIVGPPSPRTFRFTATWNGTTVQLIGGQSVTVTGNRTDSKNLQLYNGVNEWSELVDEKGNVIDRSVENLDCTLYIPAEAYPQETEIAVYDTASLSTAGLSPETTDVMIAVQIEQMFGPEPMKPIDVKMTYDPSLLEGHPHCLAASSVSPYRWDDVFNRWVKLQHVPFTVNPDEHTVTFSTDRLGLFALAAENDNDCDNLGNYEELRLGTDPDDSDSDNDTILDGDEKWLTHSDPLDPLSMDENDQHAIGTGLIPGQTYYIAGRLLSNMGDSEISENAIVQAAPCDTCADLNCDQTVNYLDLTIMAQQWLQGCQ